MDAYPIPEPCPECGDLREGDCFVCALLDAFAVTAGEVA